MTVAKLAQDPHRFGGEREKNLEVAIGREVRAYRRQKQITVAELATTASTAPKSATRPLFSHRTHRYQYPRRRIIHRHLIRRRGPQLDLSGLWAFCQHRRLPHLNRSHLPR